eukprot:NODE_13377_length_1169_cov_4.596929.p1 GENE.NODE_13377_length_1169_cov_4.596929~~NODE_13377_length_1169_cov_4.596929.p1  ORF type:complete len:332 (-),score=111.61 NODE_13377_length_1169_cov_4.596929:92-1087(-)
MKNGHRPKNDIDSNPQQLVARKMADIAAIVKPEFVINVGDDFYPGGIEEHCDARWAGDVANQDQFKKVFEDMYKGPGLDGKEWLGVLGNHDYGGWEFDKGWIQAIYYTWAGPGRWMQPALYYSRRYNFKNFTADFFFVDSNIIDTFAPNAQPNHNICSAKHNGRSCDKNNGDHGPKDPHDCVRFFRELWNDEVAWLHNGLGASTADWQIVVTHFPPDFSPLKETWLQMARQYGIDLFITGHRHMQEVHVHQEPFGDTAWVVTGGGGGVTSEGIPAINGDDDQYGFLDFEMQKGSITIKAYAHGGREARTVIRSTTTIYPRARAEDAVVVQV